MASNSGFQIAVIGAGVAGIAAAYYLCTEYRKKSVLLIDSRPALSFTSAQSGDNYRNWWPHPVMVDFTNYSIDLIERIAVESSNVFNMTRGGYAVATRRSDIDALIADLHAGYGAAASGLLRFHSGSSSKSYRAPVSSDWAGAPDGVDVLSNRSLIRRTFGSFSKEIARVVHIRRAGGISGHLMGQYMLERIREGGGKLLNARVRSVGCNQGFELEVDSSVGVMRINADVIVNAAGPFAKEVAAMIDEDLPIENVFQQKILFEDRHGAIPRQLPFSIDIDDQILDWTGEERELLACDAERAWLIEPIPGGTHCRPEGGDEGAWVKLG